MPAQVGRADRHVVLRLQRPVGRWSVRRLAAAIARARREPPEVVVVDLSDMGDLDERVAFRMAVAWDAPEDVVLVSPEVDRTRAILHEARPDLEVPPVFPTVDAALTALDREDDPSGPKGFRHEAFAHRGGAEYVEGVAQFLADGLDADEVVIAALPRERFEPIRHRLGRDARRVHLIGPSSTRNPAMAIPWYHELIAARLGSGQPLRVVAEPTWEGARPVELLERQHQELLVDRAFGDADGVWLLCAYDLDALPRQVLQHGCRSHPYLRSGGRRRRNDRALASQGTILQAPLPPPGTTPEVLAFGPSTVHDVARTVARRGAEAGLWADELRGLALAAMEVADESALVGGGRAVLRVWNEDGDTLVCEISDDGRVLDPLTGLVPPEEHGAQRRGPWAATQRCDLVQVRSDEHGTVVRLHQRGTRLRAGPDGWLES